MEPKRVTFSLVAKCGNGTHTQELHLSAGAMEDELAPMVSDMDACRQLSARALKLVREEFTAPPAPAPKAAAKPRKNKKPMVPTDGK